MPLGTPQDFSLSLSFGGYQKALSRQRFLRNKIQRFRCCCKQAITFYFIPCRAAKQAREKNIYAFSASLAALPPRAAGGECKNSCCLGRGGPWSSRFFAAGRSHCFARSLCGLLCYFFVIQQRSNQESEPGRSLRDLPFRAALQSRLRRKTSMLFLHLTPPCHHARQAEKAKMLISR